MSESAYKELARLAPKAPARSASYKPKEYIEQLWFYGCTQAVSMMLLAQVVYLNLHYIVGASLTIAALASFLAQQVMSVAEHVYLSKANHCGLAGALNAHFWLNRVFAVLFVPFVAWAVALMYEHVGPPFVPP